METIAVLLGAYHSHRYAYGAQVGLDYEFLNKAYSILGFWYTYLSGDADDYGKPGGQAGRKFTGWDPMFEDQTGGELINLILPQTNSHTIVVYFFTYLGKNVNMLLRFTDQMLVKNYFSNRYAITEGPAYGNYYYLDAKNKHIGDELDCKITLALRLSSPIALQYLSNISIRLPRSFRITAFLSVSAALVKYRWYFLITDFIYA